MFTIEVFQSALRFAVVSDKCLLTTFGVGSFNPL